jgi:hypothetical protein
MVKMFDEPKIWERSTLHPDGCEHESAMALSPEATVRARLGLERKSKRNPTRAVSPIGRLAVTPALNPSRSSVPTASADFPLIPE